MGTQSIKNSVSNMVERYAMIVAIMAAQPGCSFDDLSDLQDYQLTAAFNRVQNSKMPDHLGIKRK
jgi:hypothetical protein